MLERGTQTTRNLALTGEVNLLLLFLVEVLLGQGIETGRHDGYLGIPRASIGFGAKIDRCSPLMDFRAETNRGRQAILCAD